MNRAWLRVFRSCKPPCALAPHPRPGSPVQAAAAATSGQGTSAGGANNSIRVVTYNILANKYAIGGHHNYCIREHLEWPSRRNRIQAELSAYAADIVCLQEVEARVFHQEMQPFFSTMGLQGWFLARQSGELLGPPEGVALFVNSATFQVLGSHTVRFSDHAADVADTARTDSDGWRLFKQKEEGVVMALLLHRGTGQKVIAASAHLFWNPRFPDVKVLQAAVLCQQLARFACQAGGATQPADLPLILGGDFNSMPCKLKPDVFDRVIPRAPGGLVSGVYKLLQEGLLLPSHPDYPTTRQAAREGSGGREQGLEQPQADGQQATITSAGLRLKSMHHLAHGREPVLTTRTATFAGCLDYIWISPEWLAVEETLELPYADADRWADPMEDVHFPAIPDETFPSDHLAMGCILRIMPRSASKGA